jgi:hypothetical protein
LARYHRGSFHLLKLGDLKIAVATGFRSHSHQVKSAEVRIGFDDFSSAHFVDPHLDGHILFDRVGLCHLASLCHSGGGPCDLLRAPAIRETIASDGQDQGQGGYDYENLHQAMRLIPR